MTLAVDRFRGAGGWSVACERLGITDEGVEFMPEANATAAAAGYSTVGLDVWDFWYPANYYEVEIASPPLLAEAVLHEGIS